MASVRAVTPGRGILAVWRALAAGAAFGMADMLESQAGTDLPKAKLPRSTPTPLAQPVPAQGYQTRRTVVPGSSVDPPSGTGRARAQERPIRSKAAPLPKSALAPTTHTQPPAPPVPASKPAVPKPPVPVAE